MLWSSAVRSSSLPFYIFLLKEKVPLDYTVPSIDKWYPFQIPSLELCITFSCYKCTVFKLWINQKTRKLSRLFHSHKILLLALLGPFTDQNDTDFSTLSYTSTIEILTLSYTWGLEEVPLSQLGWNFPVKAIIGGTPRDLCLLFSQWVKQSVFPEAISMLQNWLFSCVECLGNGVRGWWLVLFSFFILDLDECKDKTHQCDVNANCTNIPGSYNCTCRPGYTGNGSICNGIISYPSLHFMFLQVYSYVFFVT